MRPQSPVNVLSFSDIRGLRSLLLFDTREIRRRYQVASFSFRVAPDQIISPRFPFSGLAYSIDSSST